MGVGGGSREGFSCDEQRGSISEIGIFNLYSDMSHLGPWHLRKAYSLQLSETLICISLPWLLLEMSSLLIQVGGLVDYLTLQLLALKQITHTKGREG